MFNKKKHVIVKLQLDQQLFSENTSIELVTWLSLLLPILSDLFNHDFDTVTLVFHVLE